MRRLCWTDGFVTDLSVKSECAQMSFAYCKTTHAGWRGKPWEPELCGRQQCARQSTQLKSSEEKLTSCVSETNTGYRGLWSGSAWRIVRRARPKFSPAVHRDTHIKDINIFPSWGMKVQYMYTYVRRYLVRKYFRTNEVLYGSSTFVRKYLFP